jgi:cold shock CspA family protein/ribosome-associated translation inhibitor RaiA
MDLEISAQHIEVHPRWRSMIERHVGKLNGIGANFLRLHVTLVHSTHHTSGHEEVRILASLPGDTLRVQKTKARMGDAIHAAFAALHREVESYLAQRRSPDRLYGPRPSGFIARVFRERGYGFIRTAEDQEIYFHQAALHDLTLEELRQGMAVDFEVEQGEKGPQASRVYPPARGN